MPDFGIFRGFNEKLFGDKLVAGQLPTQLGLIGSEDISPFLLDKYSGAAAAYSLRLLSSTYTGDAIRVRRSSDNTEQDIGFVNNKLDTSSLLSFVGTGGTDNGFVKTWYDQSGNGRDATQTTASNQPQIVSSGSVLLNNSKPSIKFGVGSNTYLLSSTFTATSPIRSFVYFNPQSINDFLFDGGQVNQYRIYIESSTTMTIYADGATSEPRYTDLTGVLNKNYLSDFLANASDTSWQINNTTPITANWNSTTKNRIRIGIAANGNFPFVGFVSEYIEYNSTEDNNADGIKTNINDFYSIY